MQIQENMTAEYYEGMIEGVTMFAHWKDGHEYVGTCGTLLTKVENEIRKIEERSSKVNV
jgi:hypothetical protein